MLAEIKKKLSELPLISCLDLILKALDFPTALSAVSRVYRSAILDRESFLISDNDFRKTEAQTNRSIEGFLDRLEYEELQKIKICISNDKRKQQEILFVEATPKNLPGLQVNREYNEIRNAISLTHQSHLGRYKLLPPILASDSLSLVANISKNTTTILHFSGHAGKNGIVLNNDAYKFEVFSNRSISEVFGKIGTHISMVFLNACCSTAQAEFISKSVDYVIGMNMEILDETAIQFSKAFYSVISGLNDDDFEKSFYLAKAQLDDKQTQLPDLWVKGNKLV